MSATHLGMTFTEMDACRCDMCVRANAAIGIGESLAEIESALEWLPRRVDTARHDRQAYADVLRFVVDFEALKVRLLGQERRALARYTEAARLRSDAV